MSYIGDIRKHIGHDLVMTVGCGILIVNDKDQVLLQKRSDTGDWCIPGGALEPFETYEEAAIREIQEEVGITVKDLRLFGIYSGEERRIHYPNDDVVYSLSVIFSSIKLSFLVQSTFEDEIAAYVSSLFSSSQTAAAVDDE